MLVTALVCSLATLFSATFFHMPFFVCFCFCIALRVIPFLNITDFLVIRVLLGPVICRMFLAVGAVAAS